ncbi:hypothetical protein C8Q75DRAFT_771339, partial [Abortiporus biennis]
GGLDFYRSHAINPDESLYNSIWGRVRRATVDSSFTSTDLRGLHRNIYGGLVSLGQILPADLGSAAAYEAYRSWKHHTQLWQPFSGNSDREREGLVGLAIAEASRLWQYSGRQADSYGLRDALESAATTATQLYYRKFATRRMETGVSGAGMAGIGVPFPGSVQRDYAYGTGQDASSSYGMRGRRSSVPAVIRSGAPPSPFSGGLAVPPQVGPGSAYSSPGAAASMGGGSPYSGGGAILGAYSPVPQPTVNIFNGYHGNGSIPGVLPPAGAPMPMQQPQPQVQTQPQIYGSSTTAGATQSYPYPYAQGRATNNPSSICGVPGAIVQHAGGTTIMPAGTSTVIPSGVAGSSSYQYPNAAMVPGGNGMSGMNPTVTGWGPQGGQTLNAPNTRTFPPFPRRRSQSISTYPTMGGLQPNSNMGGQGYFSGTGQGGFGPGVPQRPPVVAIKPSRHRRSSSASRHHTRHKRSQSIGPSSTPYYAQGGVGAAPMTYPGGYGGGNAPIIPAGMVGAGMGGGGYGNRYY